MTNKYLGGIMTTTERVLPGYTPQIAEQVFPVTIDYSLTLAEMIEAGNYDDDYCHKDIVEMYDVKGEGIVNAEIVLYPYSWFTSCFNSHTDAYPIRATKVQGDLSAMGFRSAKIEELLGLGSAHPEVQKEYQVNALGSLYMQREYSLHGSPVNHVPVLGCWYGSRSIRLRLKDFDWDKKAKDYFAVVKK